MKAADLVMIRISLLSDAYKLCRQYLCLLGAAVGILMSTNAPAQTIGTPVDASRDFQQHDSVYFIPEKIAKFDAATGQGALQWNRYKQQSALSFGKIDIPFVRVESDEFPGTEYDRDPELPFSVSFVSPRAVRLRFATRGKQLDSGESLMLDGPVAQDDSWKSQESDEAITFTSSAGEVRIVKEPWRIEIRDPAGKLLTQSRTIADVKTYAAPMPFSFVRRERDLGHSTAASFQLAHDEKIFGCGESFTRLDKRGQKILLYLRDAMGVQTRQMYKPIPFFQSSRGYGMFIHTSTPVTCDFGHDFDESNVLYTGDEQLDIFIFIGTPKEILTEYTAVTGRSPLPPLWSFGLWMSRITYKSEAEVREVTAKLREHKIPCDVIHLDTGWFETDWQCNYEFAASRFDDPVKMISDLKQDGFRTCLWQLPYFTTKNELFDTIVDKGFAVKNEGGNLPYLDAILDFSNSETIEWYQGLISGLLKQGVGAIKVDFGEESPLHGIYASGRSGWYEHNLYPLRYNKTVAEITKQTTGENIIWARSAWAGSQRYPLHWGGDSENTDSAMAATLRAGLSLGICGFSYWSHDMGGFVDKPSTDLYRRWVPFGMLTSHSRCHGAPPREPWEYGEEFESEFRKSVELKYKLMPYIYAQAKLCSEQGHPLLRTLFFEFPEDPTSWMVEDEYMFGSDLLVAPLFASGMSRDVYLPPGEWIDYQSGQSYEGAKWHKIAAGEIPIVLLVRSGAVVPHLAVSQSTDQMDWKDIELRVFGEVADSSVAYVTLPDGDLQQIRLTTSGGTSNIQNDPYAGRVTWRVIMP
jgi:alpha-D-xyloside xylohydrolase